MTGVYSDVVARIKEVAPYCKATRCIIHHEMLATEKMSVELISVLNEVIKIIDFVKVSTLNSHLFSLICQDMDEVFTSAASPAYGGMVTFLGKSVVSSV
jgi:hypothetical protein